MSEDERGSRPVMVRVPWPMYRRLQEIAEYEATSVATVMRRLAMERMRQMDEERLQEKQARTRTRGES